MNCRQDRHQRQSIRLPGYDYVPCEPTAPGSLPDEPEFSYFTLHWKNFMTTANQLDV